MSINQALPFFSTAIMLGFTIYVLQRFFIRRQLHFLFWGVGLAMFGAVLMFAGFRFAARPQPDEVFQPIPVAAG